MRNLYTPIPMLAILLAALPACNSRKPPANDGTCDPAAPECPAGRVCEPFVDAVTRCAAPVLIVGRVVALIDESPIEGAIVQAIDINGAAVGTSGTTDADGAYTLTVPVGRDAEGRPVNGILTLRVQAAAFQEFPTAIRPALPLDATTAAEAEEGWVIENALTTVALIALPGDTSQLGSISGTIDAAVHAGILVVAEGAGAAQVGYSDSAGVYTIFNVPAGTYALTGYAAGVQLESAATAVEVGETVSGIDLVASDRPLSTVSGSVQIVNAAGGSQTSIVLAVESTFVEAAARGSVPPGLRVGNVTGAFTIENVPDGHYVVLAAFENDNLVRDPDQNIGGTQIVRVEAPDPATGTLITISEGFKVTEALGVVGPGPDAPQQITSATPTLEWNDDASEDGYEIRVFDAFGNEVWSDEIASVSGSATVTVIYAGPALAPGMFYQFRITSFRERNAPRTAISTTEDLKGVFYFLNP